MDIQQAFGKPYLTYLYAMQHALEGEAGQTRVGEAYASYVEQMQAATEAEPAHRAAEAFATYERAVREAMPAERAQAMFEAYVTEVRAAWSEADPAELAPDVIAAIAHQLGTAAWMAGAGSSD